NIEKLDGIVKLDGVVKVLFTGINHVTIDGAAGNDRIIDPGYDTTILGGPGDDTITINATTGTGVNVDGGSGSDAYIIGGGLIGDLAGPVTIADTGATGADSVTVLGTGSNDSIAETSSGFGLNGTSITVAGLETALVDGGGGSSDQIIATGTPPIPVEVRHVSDMVVVGTAGNDQILFDPGTLPGEVVGRLNGAIVSRFIPTGKIVAYGGAGDDNIQVAGSIALPAWLYGEAGNDRLNAGNGGSLLIGGEGNDRLLGGGGRDVMIGGNGADSLIGNNSDDILVAGFTTMDDRSTAGHEEFWGDVIAEWNSSRTFNERVNNLRDGTGSAIPSNNGSFLKLNVTVLDDMFGDEIDFLNGAAGEDWLIFSMVEDKVSGQVEASN
ncbi:MAG TPA: hypothetical protein VKH44_13915, partial [Pirellulaceae bacterium]|nr:hypothetical protein [Pirellulaceae bacterium]